MAEIAWKYGNRDSVYILPVITRPGGDVRRQVKNALCRINRALKEIARMVKSDIPLTMYCARHSWASIAKSKNIPISVISEGMGHDSEMTTQIYLAADSDGSCFISV